MLDVEGLLADCLGAAHDFQCVVEGQVVSFIKQLDSDVVVEDAMHDLAQDPCRLTLATAVASELAFSGDVPEFAKPIVDRLALDLLLEDELLSPYVPVSPGVTLLLQLLDDELVVV